MFGDKTKALHCWASSFDGSVLVLTWRALLLASSMLCTDWLVPLLLPLLLSVCCELHCLQDELENLFEDCGDKVVVIDFWAGWCGPCKLVGPVFERLSKNPSFMAKIAFVKVDVDEAPDIAEWVGIECMPMIVFYRNGEKIDEMAGANPKVLEEKIKHYGHS